MYRDPEPYGNVCFWLFDIDQEKGLPNAKVMVNGFEAVSDDKGDVSLFIPLEKQRVSYTVSSTHVLLDSVITMPTTKDFIIKVKNRDK